MLEIKISSKYKYMAYGYTPFLCQFFGIPYANYAKNRENNLCQIKNTQKFAMPN